MGDQLIRDDFNDTNAVFANGYGKIHVAQINLHRVGNGGRYRRLNLRPDFPIFGRYDPLAVYLLDDRLFQIFKHDQIGLFARRYGAQMVQTKIFGRVQSGHLNRQYRVEPRGNGFTHNRIDMTLCDQLMGMAIVCTPHHPSGGFFIHHRKQCL